MKLSCKQTQLCSHSVRLTKMHCAYIWGLTNWMHFLPHKTFVNPIKNNNIKMYSQHQCLLSSSLLFLHLFTGYIFTMFLDVLPLPDVEQWETIRSNLNVFSNACARKQNRDSLLQILLNSTTSGQKLHRVPLN